MLPYSVLHQSDWLTLVVLVFSLFASFLAFSPTSLPSKSNDTICVLVIHCLLAPQSGALRISAYRDFQSQSNPNPIQPIHL